MRNISVKLIRIWTSGSGENVLRYFLSRALQASGISFYLWSGTICAILIEGIMRNMSVKLFIVQ